MKKLEINIYAWLVKNYNISRTNHVLKEITLDDDIQTLTYQPNAALEHRVERIKGLLLCQRAYALFDTKEDSVARVMADTQSDWKAFISKYKDQIDKELVSFIVEPTDWKQPEEITIVREIQDDSDISTVKKDSKKEIVFNVAAWLLNAFGESVQAEVTAIIEESGVYYDGYEPLRRILNIYNQGTKNGIDIAFINLDGFLKKKYNVDNITYVYIPSNTKIVRIEDDQGLETTEISNTFQGDTMSQKILTYAQKRAIKHIGFRVYACDPVNPHTDEDLRTMRDLAICVNRQAEVAGYQHDIKIMDARECLFTKNGKLRKDIHIKKLFSFISHVVHHTEDTTWILDDARQAYQEWMYKGGPKKKTLFKSAKLKITFNSSSFKVSLRETKGEEVTTYTHIYERKLIVNI